jgi:uncharacterized protein with beta-barrel porin domain
MKVSHGRARNTASRGSAFSISASSGAARGLFALRPLALACLLACAPLAHAADAAGGASSSGGSGGNGNGHGGASGAGDAGAPSSAGQGGTGGTPGGASTPSGGNPGVSGTGLIGGAGVNWTGQNGQNGNGTINAGGGGAGGGTGAYIDTSVSINGATVTGGNGGNGSSGFLGGGGGGAGGGAGLSQSSGTATVSSSGGGSITGGNGGNGGISSAANGGGGGGGGDGVNVPFGDSINLTNPGSISGGNGGNGGLSSTGNGGGGGAGGAGVDLQTGGSNVGNGAGSSITGGNGGAGGSGGINSSSGAGGAGGIGVFSSGANTIVNSGSISGGLAADGVTRADAVFFAGSGGQLNVFSGSTLTGNVELGITAAATLKAGNSGAEVATGVVLGNASTLTLDGSTANLLISGVISGSGSGAVTVTPGTTIFSGNNTYSGGTSISSSAILRIDNGGTVGTGDVLDNGSLVFNRGDTVTVSNNISGGGSLTQSGSGTLILGGNNVYSGVTNINSGILQINAGSALQNTSQINLNGGELLAGGSFVLNRSLFASNNATSTIAAAAGNTLTLTGGITVDSNANLTFGAAGATGTVSLGGNSATLSGPGNLEVAAGTLTGTGAALGTLTQAANSTTVDSGATLDFAGQDATVTKLLGSGTVNTGFSTTNTVTLGDGTSFSGAITGAGNLGVAGSNADVTLSGVNTYSGTTTVAASGLLSVTGSGTLGSGAVSLDGILSVQSSASFSLGAVTGAGTIIKSGSGNLTLTGANTYAGTTSISGGTLTLNGASSGGMTTSVSGTGVLAGTGSTTSAVNVNSGGTLSPGSGGVGTLTTGDLTFASGSKYAVDVTAAGAADRVNVNGTATINGGTVNVNAGSGSYARNTRYTILSATSIAGTGFAGVNSNLAFLTPTVSQVGNTIVLNMASKSGVSYGSLAGTPNQGNVAGYLSGILAAGGNALTNQIDNLTAGQAQTAFDSLSGSQYAAGSQVALGMSHAFGDGIDRHLGSVNGNAQGGFNGIGAIEGGALAFSSPAAPWGMGGDTPYQFAGMMAAGAGAMSSSAYNPTAYNTAAYNDRAYNGAGADGAYTGETGMAASAGGGFGPGLWAPNPARGNSVWSQAMGTTGRIQSDGNGAGSRYTGGGFMVGYDHALNQHWLIGVAGGYSRANWNATLNGVAPANGTVQTPEGALYARYTGGPWLVSISGGYADHKFDISRSVIIGAATNNATSTHHGGEWSTDAQVEYTLASGLWQLRPLMGVRYSHLREDSFTESGAGNANLTMDARTTDSTTVSAGARVLRPFSAGSNGGYEFKAVYSHLFGDNDSPVSARLAGQSAVFTTSGTPLKRDAVTLSAGIGAALAHNLSGFVDVQAEERGSGQEAYSIGGGLRLVW